MLKFLQTLLTWTRFSNKNLIHSLNHLNLIMVSPKHNYSSSSKKTYQKTSYPTIDKVFNPYSEMIKCKSSPQDIKLR